MSTSLGKTLIRKKSRKKTLRSHPIQAKPRITYKVGVYFPERDVLNFVIKADDFELSKDTAFFYLIGDMGSKEFVAQFSYVAYIFKQDPVEIQTQDIVSLPENWGKII